jgi:hypothetical protein
MRNARGGNAEEGEIAGIEELTARLDSLYEGFGIHPSDFRCGHYAQCSDGIEGFTPARMPSVGTRYLDEATPRIAVLSLDSGSGEKDEDKRLVRIQTKEDGLRHRNKHWYLTHEMVSSLLSSFGEFTPEEAAEHFIHLNSVKCSANLPGRKQAPWHMFMNCRWYLPDEVRAVAPEVILTQGDKARNALWGAFPAVRVLSHECSHESHRCWARIIRIDGIGEVLLLHTYHPNQRGGLYRKSLSGYQSCYPAWVEEFARA